MWMLFVLGLAHILAAHYKVGNLNRRDELAGRVAYLDMPLVQCLSLVQYACSGLR